MYSTPLHPNNKITKKNEKKKHVSETVLGIYNVLYRFQSFIVTMMTICKRLCRSLKRDKH